MAGQLRYRLIGKSNSNKLLHFHFETILSLQPLTSTPRGDPQTILFSPSPAVQLPLKANEPVEVNEGEDEPLIEKETPKRPATKGTSGPPVYYPPDHKMFTKKDVPILVIIRSIHRI